MSDNAINGIERHLGRTAQGESTPTELRLDPTTGELVLAPKTRPGAGGIGGHDGVVIDSIAEDGFFAAPRVVVQAHEIEHLCVGEPYEGYAVPHDEWSVIHAHPAAREGTASVVCRFVCVAPGHFDAARDLLERVAGSSGAAVSVVVLVEGDSPRVAAVLVRGGRAFRCDTVVVPGCAELFSRTRGLLETDALATRRVAVVGLGSGGSPIAVDLARAGVGRFVLIDPDRLEAANVSRHVCGVSDLGRLKVNAVRDAILDRNPHAEVAALPLDVVAERAAFMDALRGVDLVIAATDGNRSRSTVNRAALDLGVPAIFGRAITRAAGGDVLRVRPGEGPCLSCVFAMGMLAGMDEEVSRATQARRDAPAYVPEGEIVATVQPGLATDIAPISNMMTRLALLELSRGTNAGIRSLEVDLEPDFYVWANRRERGYAQLAPMAFGTRVMSVLRWYGVRVPKNEACLECGRSTEALVPVELGSTPPVWG